MRHATTFAAFALSLAGCNQGTNAALADGTGTGAANSAEPVNAAAPVTYADPELTKQVRAAVAEQLQEEARAMQASLPIRTDPVTQITAVRADGLEII